MATMLKRHRCGTKRAIQANNDRVARTGLVKKDQRNGSCKSLGHRKADTVKVAHMLLLRSHIMQVTWAMLQALDIG